MGLLSPSAVASMRSTLNRLQPDTAIIQRHQTVSDGGGGTTTTWSDLATVPCRIGPVGGGETGAAGGRIAEGGRIADETTHVVTVAAETDIEEADRLVVGGVTYEVTLVRKRGSWELSRRCEVKEAV